LASGVGSHEFEYESLRSIQGKPDQKIGIRFRISPKDKKENANVEKFCEKLVDLTWMNRCVERCAVEFGRDLVCIGYSPGHRALRPKAAAPEKTAQSADSVSHGDGDDREVDHCPEFDLVDPAHQSAETDAQERTGEPYATPHQDSQKGSAPLDQVWEKDKQIAQF